LKITRTTLTGGILAGLLVGFGCSIVATPTAAQAADGALTCSGANGTTVTIPHGTTGVCISSQDTAGLHGQLVNNFVDDSNPGDFNLSTTAGVPVGSVETTYTNVDSKPGDPAGTARADFVLSTKVPVPAGTYNWTYTDLSGTIEDPSDQGTVQVPAITIVVTTSSSAPPSSSSSHTPTPTKTVSPTMPTSVTSTDIGTPTSTSRTNSSSAPVVVSSSSYPNLGSDQNNGSHHGNMVLFVFCIIGAFLALMVSIIVVRRRPNRSH
jgi:hypothetical protein